MGRHTDGSMDVILKSAAKTLYDICHTKKIMECNLTSINYAKTRMFDIWEQLSDYSDIRRKQSVGGKKGAKRRYYKGK